MTLKQTRITLATVTLILICVGIVMIYSASAIQAYENLQDSAYYLKRHLGYVFLGLLCCAYVMSIDYQILRKAAKPLLLISAFLLLILHLPGVSRDIGGARRWFRFAGLSFQPSELAKFAIIVYVADFLARKKSDIQSFWHGFFPVLAVVLTICAMIIIQPDLGTVLAVLSICFILFFIGGVNIKHLLSLVLLGLPVIYMLVFSVDYRRRRMLAFLDPWSDPHGSGFQIIQSLVALGSGGVAGLGLGQGKQKLLYLPAAYTDFIFSIIGEELGFIGTSFILVVFFILLVQATKISLKADNAFAQFLAFGLVSGLVIEALVNMSVATSLMPTKGLPFPFISYGGTSLVFNMIYIGLILNIGREK